MPALARTDYTCTELDSVSEYQDLSFFNLDKRIARYDFSCIAGDI
jgi:hypothetical protein